MKALLVLVLGITAGGAAAVTAGVALGHAPAATAPVGLQHVRMTVLDDLDHMRGQNLVLRAGPVELTVVNHASHAHLFAVPSLGVQHVVLPHATAVLRFTVGVGVFHWFCKFPPCAHAMNGDIYVSEHPAAPHGAPWALAA